MNTQPIAVKFVSWEISPLDTLRNSRVYNLRDRLNNGEKMNRKDKNWLAENLKGNAYFCTAVPLMGYRFDFSDVIRKFLVNQYGMAGVLRTRQNKPKSNSLWQSKSNRGNQLKQI